VSIRVLIADDQAVVRTGLRTILESREDLSVVGEASDGDQAVHVAGQTHPDVILMDVRMPGTDGIEATRRIVEADLDPPPAILIVTTFDLDDYVFGALRAGAAGFLLKDGDADELVEAIRVVASGHGLVAPAVTRRLIEEFARTVPVQRADGELPDLSEREREVLQLVARGHSNLEIAEELFIEVSTVKSHVGSLLAKLGARDRVQAVIAAYEHGVVAPGSGPG